MPYWTSVKATNESTTFNAEFSLCLLASAGDARCNNALGLRALKRGEWGSAEAHFRAAIERLTLRNPNPLDGEPYYNLGLTLRFQVH